jgi:hypothetical protein
MVLLVGVGVLSSVLANTPVAVVTVLVLKGYLVLVDAVPEEALGAAVHAGLAGCASAGVRGRHVRRDIGR